MGSAPKAGSHVPRKRCRPDGVDVEEAAANQGAAVDLMGTQSRRKVAGCLVGIHQGYQDTVDYGDGSPFLGAGGHLDCFPGYGPWDSAARPVHEELVFQHVYEHAGTYTATFKFTTYGNCAYGPSHGTATPTITVTKKP